MHIFIHIGLAPKIKPRNSTRRIFTSLTLTYAIEYDLSRVVGVDSHVLIGKDTPPGRCRAVAVRINDADGVTLLGPNTGQMNAGAGFSYTAFLTKNSYEHFFRRE